ncbi:hypothetical protein VTN77DRAFT_3860 [Rasamsonia byssochlamydoides]|uniref:uncharacterized protein n=1 Tax=Rasamsonia byssochlamydoides TaxID=89139 RepID=UPI00374481BD
MDWFFPVWKNGAETRKVWGWTFRWTALHPSAEALHQMKFTYDRLADDCLERLNKISPPKRRTAGETLERDLYALLRDNASRDDKLQELWDQVNTIPDWVDWEQIERGQEVFYRYGMANLSALPFQSLLGGMGAGRIAEVLVRTGGFSPKVARRRLFETTQHVLQVTRSLDSIKPGGDGHASSVRVRFLHSAVRQHITKLAQRRPDYWNLERFGVPVNDLDCILTICAFSTVVIYLGLPRQGIWLTDQEIADYVALWRLVGYYLGTPTEPFENAEKARAWMESLLVSELQPTETSQVLARNILLSLDNNYPLYASREFMEALVRWMNGNELSDKLGMRRPSMFYWVLVAGYCLFIVTMSYIQRIFPDFDKNIISIRRRRYYRLIMDEKQGLGKETKFNFKYAGENTVGSLSLGETVSLNRKKRGIETMAYVGLMIAGLFLAIVGSLAVLLLGNPYVKQALLSVSQQTEAYTARLKITPT